MKKARWMLFSMLIAATLLLSACATPTPAVTQEAATQTPVVITQAPVVITQQVEVTAMPTVYEPVTITFWYALGGSQGELLQAMIDEFNATNPYKITVEATYSGDYGETAQKVMTSLESGDLPNGGLIAAGPLWTCREENYLIEEYMNGSEGLNKDEYWPVLWDYNTYEGHICSLPFNNSTMVMYYNKDLMTKAGLDPEAPPKTWDELVEQAKAIQTAAPGTIGVEVRDQAWWLKALILQNGGEIMNADSTEPMFNQPAGVEALTFWKQLVTDKVMPPTQHDDSRDLFIAGQIAFWMSSTGNVARVRDGAQFQWGTAYLPCNEECGGTVGGAALAMFPGEPAEQDATWRFLKWLVSPNQVASWTVGTGYVPILKSAAQSAEVQMLFKNEPYFQTGFDQLEVASQYPHFWEMGTMDELLATAIEQVELDIKTPEEAMNEAAQGVLTEMGK